MTKNNIYLASKPRYEILDGLRGVAAMLVVAYLLLDSTSLHDLLQFLAHRPVVHPPEHQFVFL